MKVEGNELIFKSGRKLKAGDYICLSLDGGAAIGVDEQYYPYFNYEGEWDKKFTPEERTELAAFMAKQWKLWAKETK